MNEKSITKEGLDAIARGYHLNSDIGDKQFDRIFHQRCFDWIRKSIRPGGLVLEMGFGEGNVTRELLHAGFEVEIIEGAASLVAAARQAYGGAVRVNHALFSEFQIRRTYDAILATNILEHVDDPAATLACIRRWCGPNTDVILTVPNAESLHRRLAVLMGIQPSIHSLSQRDHLVGHQRVYDSSRLKNEITAAGFKILQQKGFMLKALPNSMLSSLPQNLIEAFHDISDQLDPALLADLGFLVRKAEE